MNAIFFIFTAGGLVLMLLTNPAGAPGAMLDGAKNAVTLCVTLVAVYAVWLGIMKVMEKSGLASKLSNLMKPLIRRLFKGEKEETLNNITLNLAANVLGMGGAATPYGLAAVALMEDDGKPTRNLTMFTVINATSIQLIPATVIALRASAGSANAADIMLPTFISTAISTLVGIVLVRIFVR